MSSPLISVITPLYKPVLSELQHCVRSAKAPNVEHILVVDGRDNATDIERVTAIAAKYGARLVVREENGGISRATNFGAESATGEFVLFLDQDDYLEKHWAEVFETVSSGADYVYSDVHIVSPRGRILLRVEKPDWSPLRLAFNMYACHFFAVRRTLFEALGGMRPEFDGAQDHDLALRLSRETDKAVHIRQPLYNWRQSAASTAANPENKPWAFEAGVAAANDHYAQLGINAEISALMGFPGCYRAIYAPRTEPISIVVPTAFGKDSTGVALLEILFRSLPGHFGNVDGDEIIIISGGEDDRGLIERYAAMSNYPFTHIVDSSPFNFSTRCNIGMDATSNELILLLNDDIEFTAETSLDQLVGTLNLTNVGLVGAQLRYTDGSVQHAGHTYGRRGPTHAYYRRRSQGAPLGELVIDREVSGVTGALLLQRKSVWRAVGGFNMDFPLNYNDVDYSLKIRALGYSIMQVNSMSAIHHESQTRETAVAPEETARLYARWPHTFVLDVFTR